MKLSEQHQQLLLISPQPNFKIILIENKENLSLLSSKETITTYLKKLSK